MADTTELDGIIARVQKLRALADPTKNDNINEVKAAAALYEKLVQQYRLTEAQLESEGHRAKEAFTDDTVLVLGRRLLYVEHLLRHLCAHFGGAFFVQSGRNRDNKGECLYFLTARASDWKIISYFLNYLIFEIDRVSRKACKGLGIRESNSFRCGMAEGIGSLFAEQRKKAKEDINNCTAMVILDKREGEAKTAMYAKHNLRKGAGITGGTSRDAHDRGFSAGRNVSINKGLNQ